MWDTRLYSVEQTAKATLALAMLTIQLFMHVMAQRCLVIE